MKEYRKNIRIIYWLLLPMGAIGTLSVYFEEWFPWSIELYSVLCACVLPVIVLSPMKYYCGIVSLRISGETIERVWLIFKTCTITRNNATAFSRSILGMYCMIFSNSDLSHDRISDILRAVFKREAIIFPYVYQIKRDFPELFM